MPAGQHVGQAGPASEGRRAIRTPGGCWALRGLTGSSQVSATQCPSPQGILREGLEEVKQFFKANGSCRLPLSPSLLVKGIVPRVSAGVGLSSPARSHPSLMSCLFFPRLAGLLLFQLQRRPPEALLPER